MIKLTTLFEQKKEVAEGAAPEVEVLETSSWVSPRAVEAVVNLPGGRTHLQLRGVSVIVKESVDEVVSLLSE